MRFSNRLVAGSTLALLILCTSVVAKDVAEMKARSGVYRNKNGKLEKVGDVDAHEKFNVLAKTTKGSWVKINYHGKVGWLPANRVTVYPEGSRSLASVSGKDAGQFAAQLGLLFETSSIGIGIGGGGHYRLPLDLPRDTRIDAGLILAYFPSISATSSSSSTPTVTTGNLSASGFELLFQGRYLKEIQPGLDLGGDAGFIYRKVGAPSGSITINNTTVPITSTSSSGSSNFSLHLGGLASYLFAQNFRAVGGVRLMLTSPVTLQLHAGAEYRF